MPWVPGNFFVIFTAIVKKGYQKNATVYSEKFGAKYNFAKNFSNIFCPIKFKLINKLSTDEILFNQGAHSIYYEILVIHVKQEEESPVE